MEPKQRLLAAGLVVLSLLAIGMAGLWFSGAHSEKQITVSAPDKNDPKFQAHLPPGIAGGQ